MIYRVGTTTTLIQKSGTDRPETSYTKGGVEGVKLKSGGAYSVRSAVAAGAAPAGRGHGRPFVASAQVWGGELQNSAPNRRRRLVPACRTSGSRRRGFGGGEERRDRKSVV